MSLKPSYSLLLLLTLFGFSSSQLEAIVSPTNLPKPCKELSAIYDGDDKIFLFGGKTRDLEELTSVLQFEISTNTISTIASFPIGRYGGGTVADVAGNIVHFGGFSYRYKETRNEVYKLTPNNGTFTKISDLEDPFEMSTAVPRSSIDPSIAYLVGGFSLKKIRCFNTTDSSVCGETVIPNDIYLEFPASIVHEDKAFIFAKRRHNILIFDFASQNLQSVENVLPEFFETPNVVTDGIYAYLLGGWEETPETPKNSLIRFNLETLNYEFLSLENAPGSHTNRHWFYGSSSVYVEKLNKIFVFGGNTADGNRVHDEIWSIDLPSREQPTTEMPVTTTTPNPHPFCNGKPNGMYPHPADCSLFIGCRNGQAEVYGCPPPLLFDPVNERCNYPQFVQCDLSCVGKPDGVYPHPHSCELFLGCLHENMDLFKCPPPLLFHAELLACRFPEEVDCQLKPLEL